MSTIVIWHNIATDDAGRHVAWVGEYAAGHPLVPVAKYETNDADVLNEAWRLFNVGEDPAFGTPSPIALEYRARRNRSLSVGDVISVTTDGETVWSAVEALGFSTIERPAWFARKATVYGTTPIEEDPFA